MFPRKNRLALTTDAKQRTVGFPEQFANKVAIILSAEKLAKQNEVRESHETSGDNNRGDSSR